MVAKPDPILIEALNKYVSSEGEVPAGGDNVRRLYENLQNPEMLIPVLGLQGVGKSTLINGILKENVMPNEADETTCIPVEVRYATEASVQIHFMNGNTKSISGSEISEYVDNNYNRGNEKQVSHIVIYRDIELLKSGIVLVDLPGVGSMTVNNQETTKRYIKNLYSAIFVIRVNPPITRTEASFIKLAWSTLSSSWFVQNRWNNENDREVAEGLEANQTILKDIADKTKTPYNGEIITVNAYKALKGILQKQPEDYAASNISTIVDKLSSIHSDWKEQADLHYQKKAQGIIGVAEAVIRDLLEKCNLTKEELAAKLQEEEADFARNTEEVHQRVKEVKELLEQQKLEASSYIKKLARKAEDNIRVNIYRIIDGGVTDGEDLTQAFSDYQNQEFEVIYEEYMDFTREKTSELSKKIADLNELILREKENNFSAEAFSKNQELKWEKGMDVGIKLGGGVGAAVVGLKVGTAIGSFFAPPLGTIIGGAAGILAGTVVGIFTSFIGGGSKKLVMAERASATKREISPVITQVCEKIQGQLSNSFEVFSRDITTTLEQYHRDRMDMAKKQKNDNIALLKEEDHSEQQLQELTKDLSLLKEQEASFCAK